MKNNGENSSGDLIWPHKEINKDKIDSDFRGLREKVGPTSSF